MTTEFVHGGRPVARRFPAFLPPAAVTLTTPPCRIQAYRRIAEITTRGTIGPLDQRMGEIVLGAFPQGCRKPDYPRPN